MTRDARNSIVFRLWASLQAPPRNSCANGASDFAAFTNAL